MKILVAVKRVVDAKIKVRPLPDHSGVDVKLAKMAMNPFDEIAIEKAVTLREAGVADEVVAVTVGPLKAVDTLRVAMAIGADRAVHVRTDESLEPLAVAKVLRAVVEREKPDLVLLGKQAIDDDANQTGQMLSALCDMPLATFANEIVLEGGRWVVTRETDGGTQTVSLATPAVVTADLRLAEPRYVTLPAMGKARKKPVEDIELAGLGIDNVTLKSATAQALTAALRMTDVVDVLVAGSNGQSVAEQAAKLSGVRTVYYADHPQLAQESPEVLARLVLDEAEGYSHVLFVASAVGKSAMPRVAAKLDVSPVSDVLDVKGPKTFVRGIYAGSLLATVEVTDPVVVATIRTTAFEAAAQEGSAVVEEVIAPEGYDASRFVRFSEAKSDRPELVSARIVVGGGRGLLDEAGFKTLEAFADSIGAAVGATRTAVDMGLCPNDWQVGQTGKMIAPELYIAVGISGAIQHTAGIKDAKTVVAINKDAEAPIFEVADYGLVADGVEALEALRARLGTK